MTASCTKVGLVLLALIAGCRQQKEPGQATDLAPTPARDSSSAPTPGTLRLVALVPDSVSARPNAFREISIRGSGFAAGAARHAVSIGPITLDGVPADAQGSEIRVVIPERFSGPGGGPPRPLLPGTYDVSVRLGERTSNSLSLRVLP